MVARRAERLERIASEIRAAGGEAVALAADLADETERLRLYDEVRERCGPVDVLVNNAGLGWYGYAADMPWAVAREMIGVNAAALVHLSLLCLREMRLRDSGRIINVSSVVGGLPSQGVALYGATKAMVDAFTTALHRETRGTKVSVSDIRPGAVATEFFRTAAARPAGRPIPAERFGVPPERVAAGIWRLLRKPRRTVYIPGLLKFVPWVELLFGWLIDRLGPLLLRRSRLPAHTGPA